MRLKRLAVNRLPGIDQPFEIELAEAGFHVVFGPNGIGKSSLCRALKGLYWPDHGPGPQTSVFADFELEGVSWWAERQGERLRWQRAGEDSPPPDLPPAHNHHCFFLHLRDLMDPAPEGTQDIAADIRRQMSGGFDLDQVVVDLFARTSGQHGRNERREFNEALRGIQDAEGRQTELQRRADRLHSLKAQLAAAETAGHRLPAVDRALGLAGRQQDLADIQAELAILPAPLARLSGNEAEQLERLQAQLDGYADRARSAQGELEAASRSRAEIALPGVLDAAELAAWRVKAGELDRLDMELQAAETEHSARRQELAAALAALGGGEPDEAALNLDDHRRLFEFLRLCESQRARVEAIEERLRLLSQIAGPEAGPQDLEKLRDAGAALRSWLRLPQAELAGPRTGSRRLWLALATVLAVAGAGLGWFGHPAFVLLLALGAGMALPVLLPGRSSAGADGRERAVENFTRLGLDGPAAWDEAAVELKLRQFDGEAATLEAQLQRGRDREVERQTLQNELQGLKEAGAGLEAERRKLLDDLGLEAIRPDAELVDFARALDQFRLARGRDEAAAAKVADLGEKRATGLKVLGQVLERHGEPESADVATAAARLDNLEARNTRLIQALSDERRAGAQRLEIATDREQAETSRRRIFAEAGLADGDLPRLAALLSDLPRYHELKSTADRLQGQIDLDRDELDRAGEAELADSDTEALERRHDKLSQKAETASDLRNEIADTENQVRQARRAGNLQDLLSAREEARARLDERRLEALFVSAGRFLIDAVEEEHVQTQMPRVFERARSHFSAFTDHHFELHLGQGPTGPELIAMELGRGEGKTLAQLSDGTRTQLLLAARLAFAEEVERGKTLPLFLDEALDQSDPGRFEAMVRSLGRVARQQRRQIIYFTSDPLDRQRIQQALAKEGCELAGECDLGAIRGKAASVTGLDMLKVEGRPRIPPPGDLSSEAYGLRLEVPAFRPVAGAAAQHFFYLLWDELELLHDFLERGLKQVGQWKVVSNSALAEELAFRSLSAQEIADRLDLLEVFCGFWNQGRGRPVDREALVESGALSERWLEDVVAVAAELKGDAGALLVALEERKDERLKGFRRNSFEQVDRYLRDHGNLDEQPVLREEELRLRAFATPAAGRLGNSLAGDCLHRWWRWALQS